MSIREYTEILAKTYGTYRLERRGGRMGVEKAFARSRMPAICCSEAHATVGAYPLECLRGQLARWPSERKL